MDGWMDREREWDGWIGERASGWVGGWVEKMVLAAATHTILRHACVHASIPPSVSCCWWCLVPVPSSLGQRCLQDSDSEIVIAVGWDRSWTRATAHWCPRPDVDSTTRRRMATDTGLGEADGACLVLLVEQDELMGLKMGRCSVDVIL